MSIFEFKPPKPWEEATVDDLFATGEKDLIKDLEADYPTDKRCPDLKYIELEDGTGRFYYCGCAVAKDAELKIEEYNPVILAHQSIQELQLYCFINNLSCISKKSD